MSNRFHDMELRVVNASPCPVKGLPYPDGWQYGTLYIYKSREGKRATFGDLTIPVTDEQAIYLIALAKDSSAYYQRRQELSLQNDND